MMWEYRASVIRWIDADTCSMVVDLGFRTSMQLRIRLIGSKQALDAYERNAKNAEERDKADKGILAVNSLAPIGDVVTLRTTKDTPSGGFDRYLGQIITESGINVGDYLLDTGLARVWHRN